MSEDHQRRRRLLCGEESSNASAERAADERDAIVPFGAERIARHAQIGELALVARARSRSSRREGDRAGRDRIRGERISERAQDGLHEGLVRELAGSGIRFTTVYPDNIRAAGSEAVTSGEAMSYDDVADVIMWVLNASPTVWIQEILMTSPNHPR